MRKETNRLLDMIEEGLIDPHAVADMCLAYMSEDDVADMMRANDLLEDEEENEDWDECADPDAALDDFNYVGSPQHY
jgi:hypothetical protein